MRPISVAFALAAACCVLSPALAANRGTTVEVTHGGKLVASARVTMLASDFSENYPPQLANQYGHVRFVYTVTKAMEEKRNLQLCWQAFMPTAPIRSSDKLCFAPAHTPDQLELRIP